MVKACMLAQCGTRVMKGGPSGLKPCLCGSAAEEMKGCMHPAYSSSRPACMPSSLAACGGMQRQAHMAGVRGPELACALGLT